jgi:hypothetical protein
MKTLVLCCAVALAPHGVVAHQSRPFVATDWGAASAGLRMSISPAPTAGGHTGQPAFYIAIENVGDSDVILNLGTMISNGKVMFPEAVRLLLSDSQSKTRELHYVHRRYPGIAGRVDDFIVALRAASVHVLRVSLDNYSGMNGFVPELERGRYRIEARLDGQGARSLNVDTEGIGLFNFWKGTLRSNVHVFDMP